MYKLKLLLFHSSFVYDLHACIPLIMIIVAVLESSCYSVRFVLPNVNPKPQCSFSIN